ncbi:hypothetical protein BD410DRAFT_787639 [Rickenella mellea]|uniref:F-box domain-containing protein n=1 Tax=Rickenella mellea TaxID=50990 RepID=A0A4Y7Q8Z7_9AGAM|nr:hypothetical protein BD410DRAFT_787639 [Rickenella mellea]
MSSRNLLDLPSEIIATILEHLHLDAMSKFSRTCRTIHSLVMMYGWASYLKSNAQPSPSLACTETVWSPFDRVRYDVQASRAWSEKNLVARPLSDPWHGKLRPRLAISHTRLVVAAGSTLYIYKFISPHNRHASPGIRFEAQYVLNREGRRPDAKQDISAVNFVPDGGQDRRLCVASVDGVILMVTLPCQKPTDLDGHGSVVIEECYSTYSAINAMSASGNTVISLSSTGTASLLDLTSRTITSTLELNTQGWSTHLNLHASAPYVALGTSCMTSFVVHTLRESEMTPEPTAILSTTKKDSERPCPVFAICNAPPSFPSDPTQCLVGGYFDGGVRIFDLRSSRRVNAPAGIKGSALAPVMGMNDPWSLDALFSVSAGGAVGTHIAAGSARHSVVAFWDVRHPRDGWSVHAPGNDSSPVYSVLLESSRLFGVTQSRPFVYDFGSGVTAETYPRIRTRADRNSHVSFLNVPKQLSDGIGFYVTKYDHSGDGLAHTN